MTQTGEVILDEQRLIARILESQNSGDFVSTRLQTDERVIARVTDGIYRQPASALRELISNAYDADATRVVIQTDAPRFDRISVEDDGVGMTPATLAHLLRHIGGSAKRNDEGRGLGVTSQTDLTLSPGGRKLIGKIGIGLFSVSQLTHSFQIVTKIAGDPYRTIATVTLRQYSDEHSQTASGDLGSEFEAGKVNIWREKAADTDVHGTTIILNSIRPQARDTLRSREIWAAIEEAEGQSTSGEKHDLEPPKYHIGRIDPASGELLKKTAQRFSNTPWSESDSPKEAFDALVNCVWDEIRQGTDTNPRLERLFDYYLRMIWQLSLAIPLPYVDGHPFDIALTEVGAAYKLSNQGKVQASLLADVEGSLRDRLNLQDATVRDDEFSVFIDQLKLGRPLRFTGLPSTSHALKRPLIFAGQCLQEFTNVAPELSGGPLEFEAYLFWAPKIAPVEHQGSLIRIHGSSGTLFDPTFMRYQVSEQTRLRQITCEIFVHRGLDSALNIDRESFNAAHPHSVYITKWLHNALRQVASAQKRLASEIRNEQREGSRQATLSGIQEIAYDVWTEEASDEGSSPPPVKFVAAGDEPSASPDSDTFVFSRATVMPESLNTKTAKARAKDSVVEEKLRAIVQALSSYHLLDSLSKRKRERLLRAIYQILVSEDE